MNFSTDSLSHRFVDDSLSKRLIFFTGKGGVGKTAVAWATALLLKNRGRRVTFASWSPFDSLGRPLPSETHQIHTVHLETLSAFKEYALHILKFDTIYHAVFENTVLRAFIRAAPGLSETVIAGKVWDLYSKAEQDVLIVDLPSSGHALSFFQSPLGIQKIFHSGFVHRETEKISEMFQDPSTRLDLVTLPEEMPAVECLQFFEKLRGLWPFHFGYLHVNQCSPRISPVSDNSVEQLPTDAWECLERHRNKIVLEQEAITLCKRSGLPMIEIPRFTTENAALTIEDISCFLESQ